MSMVANVKEVHIPHLSLPTGSSSGNTTCVWSSATVLLSSGKSRNTELSSSTAWARTGSSVDTPVPSSLQPSEDIREHINVTYYSELMYCCSLVSKELHVYRSPTYILTLSRYVADYQLLRFPVSLNSVCMYTSCGRLLVQQRPDLNWFAGFNLIPTTRSTSMKMDPLDIHIT